MPAIQILPEILSNKIAAGEVVERPASVVKELVENAIDAGSTRIVIEIENGGRSLIQISDNGTGMNHDDALLSLERYATSKIHNEKDLFSIRTLGFRGEAIPSIAAVSRFSIVTRDVNSDSATQILVEGGRIKKVLQTGAPVGTMISVKQLFYNTPARRKFLKPVNTEMGHVAEAVSAIALGRPEIQFKLVHNKKTIKNWTSVNDSFERTVAVLGTDMRKDLLHLKQETNDLSVFGWISSPEITRSTSKKIYIYVNGRYIKDRGLQHALFEGYRGRLMHKRFPVAVLFITVPFERLDVNVHPTKHEVRFSDYKNLYETLKTSVLSVWDSAASKPYKKPESMSGLSDVFSLKQPENQFLKDAAPVVSESIANFKIQPKIKEKAQMDLWKNSHPELKVIGQINKTYITCESDDGIVLIDQHAAHERILFESMKKKSLSESIPVQHLLLPETIETGFEASAVLEKLIPDLKKLGLEIELFGGNTFIVKSVPALIADKEAKPLIIDIIEKTQDTGFSEDLEHKLDECLILMACHGAIRANHPLNEREMIELTHQLDRCENRSTCPHGRPIKIKWSFVQLEKLFKRIV